jgi:hypothetical protein
MEPLAALLLQPLLDDDRNSGERDHSVTPPDVLALS